MFEIRGCWEIEFYFNLFLGGFSDLINQNNSNKNWKKLLGFRNLKEKLEKIETIKKFLILCWYEIFLEIYEYFWAFFAFGQFAETSSIQKLIRLKLVSKRTKFDKKFEFSLPVWEKGLPALCLSGVLSMIFRRSSWLHTMKAFMGLLMWFGVCFLVWKKYKIVMVRCLFDLGFGLFGRLAS